jgi:hypothetical protein
MSDDIYVIVADNDKTVKIGKRDFKDDGGILVFEQYVNESSLEKVKKRIEYFGGRYGKCRIAKLVFV